MEIFPALVAVLSSPQLLIAVIAAAAVGIVVGAMPGLTAAAAIAMLLPVTYYMEPLFALAFLYVIGKSGRYGGSIAAILFNTPGTAASAATQTDGYPLAQQGKAGKAMKVATLSSVIGDAMGDMMLIFGIGAIAALALKLGPPEVFAIYFAAFVVIGSVIGKSVLKGLASASFGALVAMMGLDPISAEERYTFGIFELANGVHLVPMMIGVFVLGEVFSQMTLRKQQTHKTGSGDNTLHWHEFKPCLPHIFRGGFIGAGKNCPVWVRRCLFWRLYLRNVRQTPRQKQKRQSIGPGPMRIGKNFRRPQLQRQRGFASPITTDSQIISPNIAMAAAAVTAPHPTAAAPQ